MDPHKRIERQLYLAGLLVAARDTVGLSLEQAALALAGLQVPVTPELLESWESGFGEPSASDLIAIALVYGCRPCELLEDGVGMPEEPSEN